MLDFNSTFVILGIALCAIALLQMGMSAASSFGLLVHNKKQFDLSQKQMREIIETKRQTANNAQSPNVWSGFRPFVVSNVDKETQNTTSVYLEPEDKKPIANFLPGQHLTFRFQIPGQDKPVVRCYSLSDGPGKTQYRISVKQSLPPHGTAHPPGVASTFINTQVRPGDRFEVKAPSGHFFLDEESEDPLVLLAGGIGITPMISMLDRIVQLGSNRLVLLVYGVSHGADQPFREYLLELSKAHKNIHVVSCFSDPRPEEVENVDYQIKGFASIDLLKALLPNNNCQFYMCGPPPFMNSLYEGLVEWQVSDERIFFEAFGPASIKRKSNNSNAAEVETVDATPVQFATSQKSVVWDDPDSSLLDLAEANDVPIDSGCRAGSCGTCETELIRGKVKYPEGHAIECPPGKCLVCIARPVGPVELGA
jgi:ferredoxin-NADP reductase